MDGILVKSISCCWGEEMDGILVKVEHSSESRRTGSFYPGRSVLTWSFGAVTF